MRTITPAVDTSHIFMLLSVRPSRCVHVAKNRGRDETREGSSGSKLKGGIMYMFDVYQVCLLSGTYTNPSEYFIQNDV